MIQARTSGSDPSGLAAAEGEEAGEGEGQEAGGGGLGHHGHAQDGPAGGAGIESGAGLVGIS